MRVVCLRLGPGSASAGFLDAWSSTGILGRLGRTGDGLATMTFSSFTAAPADRFVLAVADPGAERALLAEACRSCGIAEEQFVALMRLRCHLQP